MHDYASMQARLMGLELKGSPDQPRDERGRWVSQGGGAYTVAAGEDAPSVGPMGAPLTFGQSAAATNFNAMRAAKVAPAMGNFRLRPDGGASFEYDSTRVPGMRMQRTFTADSVISDERIGGTMPPPPKQGRRR